MKDLHDEQARMCMHCVHLRLALIYEHVNAAAAAAAVALQTNHGIVVAASHEPFVCVSLLMHCVGTDSGLNSYPSLFCTCCEVLCFHSATKHPPA
jgi:hypothetical protein